MELLEKHMAKVGEEKLFKALLNELLESEDITFEIKRTGTKASVLMGYREGDDDYIYGEYVQNIEELMAAVFKGLNNVYPSHPVTVMMHEGCFAVSDKKMQRRFGPNGCVWSCSNGCIQSIHSNALKQKPFMFIWGIYEGALHPMCPTCGCRLYYGS